MPVTFDDPSEEDLDLLAEVVAEWHPHLKEHGVTIDLVLVHATRDEKTGMATGPALKHHGYAAEAIVSINKLLLRKKGLADAMIRVDGDEWPRWTVQHRRALLDHEVRHLEIQSDDEGAPKLDDIGRPKLKLLPHDWQAGIFYDVAERHKDHACEVQALRSLKKDFVQACFSFG